MGKKHKLYYKSRFEVQFRVGRAASKREVMREALAMLDAVTRRQGHTSPGFRTAGEVEALLSKAGLASAMTAKRKARSGGRPKRSTGRRHRRRPKT